MCRRSACPWNYDRHMLIPVRKNWESSARPSAFVRDNAISIQMEGTYFSPSTPQMWRRCACMMGEMPRPRSSAAERASTAAVVTAATPCMDAAIDASAADQMIAGRSTTGLPPPPRLRLPPLPPPGPVPLLLPLPPPTLLLPPPPPPRRTPPSPGLYPGPPCNPPPSPPPGGIPPPPPSPPPPTLSLPSTGECQILCAPPLLMLPPPPPNRGALGSDRSARGGEPQSLVPRLILPVIRDPPKTEPDPDVKAPIAALSKGVRTRGTLAPASAPALPR